MYMFQPWFSASLRLFPHKNQPHISQYLLIHLMCTALLQHYKVNEDSLKISYKVVTSFESRWLSPAALVYRLLARTKAPYLLQKAVHATILITATILWAFGLAAAFKARNLDQLHGKEVKHFYSFHSWMGLLLVVIFICQVSSHIFRQITADVCKSHSDSRIGK